MWWENPAQGSFSLILADGQPPSLSLLEFYKKRARYFVALDGAANWALPLKLTPDIVIGDLDSFHSELWPEVRTEYVDDQNSNDLEKALIYCQAQALKRVVILGAFGRRVDHFLTNIFVLRKYASTMELCMADESQVAFIASPGESIELKDMRNSWLSLVPLDSRIGPITTTGVKYPLSAEYLYAQHRIGTLNIISEVEASIYCESPDLLVLMPLA